jgi:hypothetical protein
MPVTIYGDLDRARAIGEELRRDGLYQRELRPDPGPVQRIGYLGFID